MFDPLVQGLPNDSYLAPVFLSLRGHDGVTPKRLAASGIAQNLLRLPIVQNKSVQTGDSPPEAAFAVIIEQVMQLESPTDRIIADAVLKLGIYLEAYKRHHISKQALHKLASGGVIQRRAALVDQWRPLHEAVGAGPPAQPAPGEHTLRTTRERQVFERLSALLVNPRSAFEPTAPGDPIPTSTAQVVDATAAGKVIVVGGAAFDHTWQISAIPPAGRSTMAITFTRSPGGKGVSQAVAAAHLDLDVSLIAAVAGDPDGREIEAHLKREGVDVSLLHRVERAGARTPTTGIYELPYGNSSASVWREIDLDVATIDRHADALSTCDVLLVTFELPQSVLKRVFEVVADAADPPVVIVTPGQPYPNAHLVSPHLKQIDYLVAHLWELEGFAFSDEAKYDPERLCDDLLSRGLRSLCLLGVPDGASVYERGKATARIPSPYPNIKESSITRDAFCAALAARLIEDRSRTDDTFLWAAAAMASFAHNYHQAPTTHPTRASVEQFARGRHGAAS